MLEEGRVIRHSLSGFGLSRVLPMLFLIKQNCIIVIVKHFYMWLKNNKFIIIKCINVYKFAKCANV